jgi:hypothetical protein
LGLDTVDVVGRLVVAPDPAAREVGAARKHIHPVTPPCQIRDKRVCFPRQAGPRPHGMKETHNSILPQHAASPISLSHGYGIYSIIVVQFFRKYGILILARLCLFRDC